jgi:hypothetical protein
MPRETGHYPHAHFSQRAREMGHAGFVLDLYLTVRTGPPAEEGWASPRPVCPRICPDFQPDSKSQKGSDFNACHTIFLAPAVRLWHSSLMPRRSSIGTKNPAAVALGKLGGKKGGKARAAKLTPERRKAIAQKAAQARWRIQPEHDHGESYGR